MREKRKKIESQQLAYENNGGNESINNGIMRKSNVSAAENMAENRKRGQWLAA
jgi:hypothetical protein